MIPSLLFFFSSRRRHTRFDCDWSSDVCSSDLRVSYPPAARRLLEGKRPPTPEVSRPPTWAGAALLPVRPEPPRRAAFRVRSEEHTSELQSQSNLVCRLLLEKKKHNHT